MAKINDLSGLGCLGIVFIFLICFIHTLVFGPWIGSQIYNWYLMDWFGTKPMNWHIAFGTSSVLGYFFMSYKKISPKNEEVLTMINFMVSIQLALWLLYWWARLFQNVNLFN